MISSGYNHVQYVINSVQTMTGSNCSLGVAPVRFIGTVHTASLTVCTVLVIFVLLMGCIGNAMVIYAAVKNKRIRTNFDVLILNLTGADFITCTFLAPIFLFLLFNEPPVPKMFCGSVLFMGTVSGMLSVLTLVAVALHRLARVVGRARGTLSLTRTAIILTLIWILSLTLSVAGTVHVTHNWNPNQRTCQAIINSGNPQRQNFVLFFVAPVIIVSFSVVSMSYIMIAITVNRQNSELRKALKTQVCRLNSKSHRSLCLDKNCNSCSSLPCRDNKALTMCLVVIVLMGLCWGPLIISHFIEIAMGESIILYQVKLCGISLVFLNSALDPYIYAQHIGKLKERYSKLFKFLLRCCLNRRSQNSPSYTHRCGTNEFQHVRKSHERTNLSHYSSRKLLDNCKSIDLNYHNNLIIHNELIRNSGSKDIMKTCLVEESIGFINASCSQVWGRDALGSVDLH